MKTFIALALLAFAAQPQSAAGPFLGQWNMTGTGADTAVVYWLEVKEEGGALKGRFLNRWSSPYDLPKITIENGDLVFTNNPRDGQPPPPVWRARVVDGKLVGTTTIARRAPETPVVVNWVGVRPPLWPESNANAAHNYGEPVSLFDGKTMDGWGVQHKQNPMNWSVIDGAMTSAGKDGNNLVSQQSFDNFKLEAEYAIAPGSNGGIYLRGRYEMQLLDDAGQPVSPQGHMAIYGRAPTSVNASLPAGEWQTMEAIVVGNRVTVTLNGQKVHDNAAIEGITGGALDANETEPGPIMLQGDHGKVAFRKVVVTPIIGR
ncbi:MAG: DUF1080 domain-containing protein [Acidobacteriota bacterium]|nr:DUF1080 domain-containing protein [Acidobacteriota bacterium]